jgi:hypothetical protein
MNMHNNIVEASEVAVSQQHRGLLRRSGAHIAAWVRTCAAYFNAAGTYEELSRLSDAELARRGLSRETLARQACDAATATRRTDIGSPSTREQATSKSDFTEDVMRHHNTAKNAGTKNYEVAATLLLVFALLIALAILIQVLVRGATPGAMAAGGPNSHPSSAVRGLELPERAGTKFDLLFGRRDLALP